jgi:hypothetical protein
VPDDGKGACPMERARARWKGRVRDGNAIVSIGKKQGGSERRDPERRNHIHPFELPFEFTDPRPARTRRRVRRNVAPGRLRLPPNRGVCQSRVVRCVWTRRSSSLALTTTRTSTPPPPDRVPCILASASPRSAPRSR